MRILPVLIGLLACSASTPEPTPPRPAHQEDHADHGDHAGHGDHADHGDHAGHMAQMEATRARLKEELGEAYDRPIPGIGDADPERGAAHYAQHCALCHGASGEGDGPAAAAMANKPSDLTDPVHGRYYSEAGRLHVIRMGLPSEGMPGVGTVLTEAELLDLYAYVGGLRGE